MLECMHTYVCTYIRDTEVLISSAYIGRQVSKTLPQERLRGRERDGRREGGGWEGRVRGWDSVHGDAGRRREGERDRGRWARVAGGRGVLRKGRRGHGQDAPARE